MLFLCKLGRLPTMPSGVFGPSSEEVDLGATFEVTCVPLARLPACGFSPVPEWPRFEKSGIAISPVVVASIVVAKIADGFAGRAKVALASLPKCIQGHKHVAARLGQSFHPAIIGWGLDIRSSMRTDRPQMVPRVASDEPTCKRRPRTLSGSCKARRCVR